MVKLYVHRDESTRRPPRGAAVWSRDSTRPCRIHSHRRTRSPTRFNGPMSHEHGKVWRRTPAEPSCSLPALAPGPVLIQSRRGALIQARFPDLVHAAAELPSGLILVENCWCGPVSTCPSRPCNDARPPTAPTAARLAEQMPAHFVVFDALQIDGHELLRRQYAECRARLDTVFAQHHLADPWTLCPETGDVTLAREWLMSWAAVPGVEGLIIRGSQLVSHKRQGARLSATATPRVAAH